MSCQPPIGESLMTDLCVIIPVYNEKDNLPVVINECFIQLEKIQGSHNIIVLDDGSNDGSAEILRGLSSRYPSLTVISHERNIGTGGIIITTGNLTVINSANVTAKTLSYNGLYKIFIRSKGKLIILNK